MSQIETVHILEDIPFDPDIPWLMKRLRIREGSASEKELRSLVTAARLIARPRAFFGLSYITARGDDWIELGKIVFPAACWQSTWSRYTGSFRIWLPAGLSCKSGLHRLMIC